MFLLLVKVKDNNVEFLVGLHDVGGVVHASPRQVGDVDESVHTAQVDEHTITGDVLHGAFEHLALLEFSDDFLALLLKFGLDECLVRHHHVAVILVDFHNLELHGLAHEHVVVTDGLNVDLATGQESLDAEHVDDHTALSAALDEALNDLFVLKRLINALPTLGRACTTVREDELTLLVLLVLDKHFHSVAHLEVGVVTELVKRNDAVRLGTDVNHHLALADRDDGTFGHFVVLECAQGLVVGFFQFFG